jgi:6-phosphofructokinase 1
LSPAKLVVGQSGGPTPVINASLAGVLEAAAQSGAFPEVWGLRHGIEGALAGDLVRLVGLSAADLDRLASTPAAALGSCRHKLAGDDVEQVLATLRRHEVRWFCYIGGNDSMDTCHQLERLAQDTGYPLAVYGIPKTIDNDLEGTDHCPGYGSAARYWATVTQEATLDLSSMRTYDRVLVLECMGRNAGWLAAATAIYKRDDADGPHVLLPPERPFDEPSFVAAVEATLSRAGYCVVAASETIRDATGRFVTRSQAGVDRFGHPIVSAVGETLAALVSERLGVKARAIKPGPLQRTSVLHVSTVDRQEAREAGRRAARRLASGQSGHMVSLQRPEMGPYQVEYGEVALAAVANQERRLPDHYLAGGSSGVTPAFVAYAAPLLGPAPEALYKLA